MTRAAGSAPRSAAIVNLGCKVNQSEMEGAARLLREAGVPLVDPDRAADLYLVNTCTVTATADEKSRAAVRRARRANPDAEIVVTGCSVQVGPEAFARIDADARLVGNEGKAAFLAELEALLAIDGHGRTDAGQAPTGPLPTLSGVATAIDGIADDRASVERTRAFVKVQDGCSFYCTYCIIPQARGAERSLAPDARARGRPAGPRARAIARSSSPGSTSGPTTAAGRSAAIAARTPRSALTLAGLVRRILAETDVERIRLSSIEPQHVDDDLLAAWVDGAPRTLPHLHLPLQSGDDGVLRRMGRRYLTADYARVVERARAAIPGVAVHADVIAGFPTEDDAAFARTAAFVRAMDLAGLHVFRYSARPGTPATRMAGHVDEPTKKARAAELLAIAAEARASVRAAGTRDGDPRPGGDAAARRPMGRPRGGSRAHRGGRPAAGSRRRSRTRSSRSGEPRSTATPPDRVRGDVLAVDVPSHSLRHALPVDDARRRPCPMTACSAASSRARSRRRGSTRTTS